MNKEMLNFQGITNEHLKSLRAEIDAELKRRDYERKQKLIEDACAALNALKREFPDIRFEVSIEVDCDYCDTTYDDYVDVFRYHNKITPDMFTWG